MIFERNQICILLKNDQLKVIYTSMFADWVQGFNIINCYHCVKCNTFFFSTFHYLRLAYEVMWMRYVHAQCRKVAWKFPFHVNHRNTSFDFRSCQRVFNFQLFTLLMDCVLEDVRTETILFLPTIEILSDFETCWHLWSPGNKFAWIIYEENF